MFLKPDAWPLWLGEEPAGPPELEAMLAPYPSHAGRWARALGTSRTMTRGLSSRLQSMNLHRRLAAVFLMLTRVGCIQGPQSQGQAPYAPYSLDSNGNVHDRGGDGGSGGDM